MGEENINFDELVLEHKDKVFNLCYRFLGNYEEADDCAQETFVKVYRSLKDFRRESSVSTWIYRIAVNTCKNRAASAQYRRSRNMVRLDEPKETEDGARPSEIGDDKLSPAKEADRREKGELIQEAIDSLPHDQKSVVILRDVEGLSYEDIAGATGLNPGTVKSKLSRARQELRKKLKGLV
ncbi:MAG: sigma-70 family RNA polymerase sigma factor [Candidatus Omnitrophota bacterium]|jgi:RNA polymerase sigma-70 factor (ECF subfamily)